MIMQIKEVKPINFLFLRTDVKVGDLASLLPVAHELYAEACKHALRVTGPVHWHYFGFDGDPDKAFTLEIALPVAQILEEYDGKFHFKRTDNFRCVSLIHEGPWTEIPKSYARAFDFINANKMTPLASNRELYINVDFTSTEANTTEIQIGVK